MRLIVMIGVALPLAACTTYDEPTTAPAPQPSYTCKASELQEHIGHTATAASGATLLRLSGARTLRWGPPNSAWTMDYREDRLNVRYDNNMKITAITCG